MIKIYLSPSNQPTNTYCMGGTNEKVQMEALASKIKTILDRDYECETVMATLHMGISEKQRPLEAKNKGCTVYLAIHSNAGGGGNASGAVAFYHPNNDKSKALATDIVKELGVICPVKSNRVNPVANGMSAFSESGYAEIRAPHNYGLITVLAETDFHDNPNTAQWMINNKDSIARAYVKAIVETFSIPQRSTSQPHATNKLYRVQVGAYAVQANAEAMLKQLKKAGFEGYIKYE